MIPAALSPLANHLWQSTLFAAVVGLLTLVLRNNEARVRYWLWLAASYKFLFPFSWLVSIGHQFEWRTAPASMPHAFSAVTEMVGGPIFLTALPATKPAPDYLPVLLVVIWAVWACGFVAVAVGWTREWLRMRAIVHAASPLSLGLPICVVSTPARLEPGVFGIFRPALLLPEGITSRLTAAQLRAVISHELCHVRRRDNLAAAVHMLVEALFWFYPLVWWLGARLIDERERACDEEVMETGIPALIYAESILKVCEFYVESPLTCLSGITGSDLKKRVQRVMREQFGETVGTWKRLLLTTAGILALALPIVAGVLTVPSHALNQIFGATARKMTFEVASVKLSKTPGRPASNVSLEVDDTFAPTGGLFSATNTPLWVYLRFAYKSTLSTPGLPAWGRTDRFDIEARAQGNPTKGQFRLMMQSLLADRFKLVMHTETRQSPIYALVRAKPGKNGPQLEPDDGACATTAADIKAVGTASQLPEPAPSQSAASQIPPIPCGVLMPVPPSAPGRIRIAGRRVTVALLAMMAYSPASGLDRPVFDHTGLKGTFDMSFEWAPRPNGLTGPPPSGFTPDETGPTFFEALQDQLGLKLDPETGRVDVLVIDHVEQPSEN
jgi:bla regulator protein blaR1